MSDERYVEDSGEKFEPDRSAPRAPMAGLPVANPERTKAEERAEANAAARAEHPTQRETLQKALKFLDDRDFAVVMTPTVDAKTGKDYVRPPSPHYSTNGVEPWDLIHDAKLNFDEGNVVKYVCRHRRKDGVIDLRKAMSYLKALAMDVYGEEL